MKALDLFCGAGGATRGLQMAGFHVTGIDIKPQPRYVGDAFIQGDALRPPVDLASFDLIWASPPCQAYSVAKTRSPHRPDHPELIEPVRDLLQASGGLYVIENVPGAPLRFPVMLCGGQFGLGASGGDGTWRALKRHRLFETNFPMLSAGCLCGSAEKIGVYGNGGGWANRFDPDRRGYKGNVAESREAMAMPWATIKELSEAIPPAYSEYIGQWAMRYLRQDTAA